MEMRHILDYHEIIDGIIIGTNACCRLHMETELIARGVEADISLEENRLDQPFGVGFYLWLPTPDHTPPSFEQLQVGTRVLKELVSLKKKVYVHCRNGHGRAPTLVAAYLIQERGMDAESAFAFLKSRRPSIHLQESQYAVLQRLSARAGGFSRFSGWGNVR